MQKIIFCYLFLSSASLYPEGFSANTVVKTQIGYVSAECLTFDHQLIVNNNSSTIINIRHHRVNQYIKIYCEDECLCLVPDQKLYALNYGAWIHALNVTSLDILLCDNNTVMHVKNVEIVDKPLDVYTLSLKTNHIFCVTKHNILAHNFDLAATPIATFILSATAPAAAAVTAPITAAIGVLGIIALYAYKKYKNKNVHEFFDIQTQSNTAIGCETPTDVNNHEKVIPCFTLTEAGTKAVTDVTISEQSDNNSTSCFPAEVQNKHQINFAEQEQDRSSDLSKKRYDGPKYNRTEDWVENHPFGQQVKKSLARSNHTNQGKRVFEVVKKIEKSDGLKKGDHIAVDALHGDHLEVFNDKGKWKHVANFDGTKNNEKTEQGKDTLRRPLW